MSDLLDDFAGVPQVLACADLVGRAGASEFTLGFLDDDPANPRWWAHAQYRGTRIGVENQPTPADAAHRLARRLLKGAHCRCGRGVTLDYHKGRCPWRLVGGRWEPGCDAPSVELPKGTRGDLAAMRRAMGADQ